MIAENAEQLSIRPLDKPEEVEYFQRLEQLIWDSPAEDVVPIHVAITVIRNGGGLLGAFAPDGPPATGGMVGLTFWFPGLGVPTTAEMCCVLSEPQQPSRSTDHAPRLKMCSHMAGVLPAWQGHRLGLRLKLAQREAILAQGLTDWVTWTYDPLQRINAIFNIRRLGAVCNTYRTNWYGEMRDGINAGTPSDRCQVDWWLSSQRVAARAEERAGHNRTVATVDDLPLVVEGAGRGRRFLVDGQEAQVLPTAVTAAGLRAPLEAEVRLEGAYIAVPIPDDINALRRADRELGLAWRLFLREALAGAFAAGYTMVDCVQLDDAGWHYILSAVRS